DVAARAGMAALAGGALALTGGALARSTTGGDSRRACVRIPHVLAEATPAQTTPQTTNEPPRTRPRLPRILGGPPTPPGGRAPSASSSASVSTPLLSVAFALGSSGAFCSVDKRVNIRKGKLLAA